jgi:hypothetical protein
MEGVTYRDMGPEEQELDWRVTRRVLSDLVLMRTLRACESGGEKHAVVAIVDHGDLRETYVSPASAVKNGYPFNAVERAFDAYTIGRGVCLLIVRDNKAVISINAVR